MENYNRTIIFEIDIMKKSSPINLKSMFLPLSKPKWHYFSGSVDALSSVAMNKIVYIEKNKSNNQNICDKKFKFDKDFN